MLRYTGCKAPVSFGVVVFVLFLSASAFAQAFANGYSYARPIVIDHRRVANSDQADFPVLVSGTFAYLATIANGGKVQNVNGYDIIFTSDAAGQTRLDHEIDTYDPVTGTVSFWVRIPTLSHTTDTAIYMWYGNGSVTTSQENKSGVWGNGYASVYHFGTSTTLKLTDSGSANYALSGNAAAGSGSIGGGASFSGGTSLTHSSVTSYPLGSSPVTLETWFKSPNPVSGDLLGYGANSSNGDRFGIGMDSGGLWVEGQNVGVGNAWTSDGNWHHVVGIYGGGQFNSPTTKVYLDGALFAAGSGGSISLGMVSNELKLGGIPTVTFCCTYNGSLDEVRVSSGTRSADWIATEYNNQSSPSTFSVACSEATPGTEPTPCILTAPPSSFRYKRPIIIDHTKIPNTDQTDFPVLISGTFPYLATAANGGQVQSASGYDIVFASDAAGQNQLDHEIDTYDPVTGTASFWVRIPSLSHSNDTAIFVWYGSPVVASQENKPEVWRNGYSAVWHLGHGNVLDATDSTGRNFGSALNMSASPTAKIGGAASFSGANNSYFDIPGISAVKPTTALTLEAWINPTQMGVWNAVFAIDYRADGSWYSPYQAYQLSSQNPASKFSFGLANVGGVAGTQTIPLLQWTHVVGTYDGSAVRLYENGVLDASASATGTIAYGSSKNLTIGNDSKYQTCCLTPWSGLMDELRISSVGRSADWIATEYNNQNSPSTFAVVEPANYLGVLTGSLTPGAREVSYSANLAAIGGTPPFTWSITSGALPAGLSIDSSSGTIQGTPTATGTSSFTVQVQDSVSATATKNLSISIFHADSLSPTTAPIGGLATITGTNFGTTQGSGTVTFNGVAAAVSSWSNTSITAIVPAGIAIGTGSATVNAYGAPGNALPITITPAPVITSLSPTQGANGTSVTITGTTFGATQGTSTITFNGLSATVTSWSDTQIVAKVPVTWSGPVRVNVDGSASNTPTFTVPAPQITSISPTNGVVGTQVTITGAYFGPAPIQYTGVNITCTAYVCGAIINTWSDTQIVATVPGGAVNGQIWVVVNSRGSNQVSFTMPNPYISSVTPNNGPVGTQIQINGTDFLATQGNSTLKLGGVPLNVVTWSNTQIIATVPETANTGSIAMVVGGVASSGNPGFTVPAPHIDSISPATAGVGNIITVSGTNFRPHAIQNSSVVFTTNWGVMEGQTISWSDTQVSARTPFSGAGMTTITGPMNVIANGVWSNAVTFTVPNLVINSLSPNTGPVGSQVTLNGANFGATQGTSSVSFNGSPAASIVSWSDTQIVATVADTTTSGPALVTVSGINSNRTLNFTVPAPQVESFSPAGGAAGAQFTINGAYFQNSQRDSTVTMNGTPVPIVSWGDTHIVATVPSGATTGPVVVSVNAVGSNTNRTFQVVNPTITSLTPPWGAVGGTVTITGTGFGATNDGSYTVKFNGVNASSVTWGDTTITATVPSGATSGPLTVVNFGATSNGVQFNLEGTPTITNVSPVVGYIGTTVTITGSGFGATQSNSTLGFNGVTATPASWSDTQITVVVPAAADSSPITVNVARLSASDSRFTLLKVAALTDSLGHQSAYIAAVEGNKTRIYSTDGPGCSSCTVRGPSQNTYDANGNVLSSTDALGHVTTYTYDPVTQDLLTESRQLDANNTATTTYTYNAFGEPLTFAMPWAMSPQTPSMPRAIFVPSPRPRPTRIPPRASPRLPTMPTTASC
jgi:YD repeat-containing protein